MDGLRPRGTGVTRQEQERGGPMFHVCWSCGSYRPEKAIDRSGPAAVCPDCGFAHPFRALPLLLVGGASGAGKSTVCQRLLGARDDVIVLDADILWQPAFDTPGDGYRAFFASWLRLCLSLNQSGRPVALFGAGVAAPGNIEPLPERRYFSAVHYLALTCDDAALEARLRGRPAWRDSGQEPFIAQQLAFNRWLRDPPAEVAPLLSRLDTGATSLDATSAAVNSWLSAALAAGRGPPVSEAGAQRQPTEHDEGETAG